MGLRAPRRATRTRADRAVRLTQRSLRAPMLALGAALVASTCAAIAFVGPANYERKTITWRPQPGSLERPLALLGVYPQHLSIELGCVATRSVPVGVALITTAAAPLISGGLALVTEGNALRLDVGFQTGLVRVAMPPAGPCVIRVRFVATPERARLSLRVGVSSASREIQRSVNPLTQLEQSWPRVVGLHADPRLATQGGAVVRIRTTPSGSSPSGRQVLAQVFALLSAAVSVALITRKSSGQAVIEPAEQIEDVGCREQDRVLRGGRIDRREAEPAITKASARFAGSDFLVAVSAGGAVVFTPPFWDDGWFRAVVNSYSSLGAFSDFWALASAYPRPVGYWSMWLTWLSFSGELPMTALRISPLVLIVGSWWVLRRWVIDAVIEPDRRSLARGVAALVFSLGIATYLMTLRPEPVVAVLAALALAAVVGFSRRPGPRPLLALATVVVLAMTVHSTGTVVALSALVVIPGVVSWCRARNTITRGIWVAAVSFTGASIGLLLMGLDTDRNLVESALTTYRSAPIFRASVFEAVRIRADMVTYPLAGPQRLWAALAMLMAVAFLALAATTRSRPARLAGCSAMLGSLGLLLTGSILPWHLAAVVPGAALLSALVVARLATLRRIGVGALVVLGLAGVAGLEWSMESTAPWAPADLAEHTWSEIPNLSLWEWAAVVAVGSAAGLVIALARSGARARVSGAVLGATAMAVLVPLALTWGLLLVDAAETPTWSYTRQAVRELTGRDRCGAGDYLRVVQQSTPLAQIAVDDWTLPPAGADGYGPTLRSGAVRPTQLAWGNWDASRQRVVPGRVATPWFAVGGVPEVVFWTLGQLTPPRTVRAEVVVIRRGGSRRLIRLRDEPSMDSTWWAFHRIEHLPARSTAMRLVVDGGPALGDRWTAVSAPVAPQYASFADATTGSAVWRDPEVALALTCRPFPAAHGGVVEPFRWSLGPPGYNGAAMAGEYAIIERGCLFPDRAATLPDERLCALELLPPR